MKQAIWHSCAAMSVAELFVTILLLFSAHYVSGFSCVCSPSECEELSESDCPGGGTVWDPCGAAGYVHGLRTSHVVDRMVSMAPVPRD
jgi:hypothetical protein